MQVAAREPPVPLLLQVTGQLVDHLGAPAALPLAAQDLPPDLPVELDQLAAIPPAASAAGCEARFGGPQRFQGAYLPPLACEG
jgi:hypothetical protein